jgi:hypothetical protein
MECIDQVLLDSESMPLTTFLLHPSSGDVMARQRESLDDTALGLASWITAVSYTSKILEAQLEDAIRFLGSHELPPAPKLHETLDRITRMPVLGTMAAAVDANCAARLGISTQPGNPQPGPCSAINLNH